MGKALRIPKAASDSGWRMQVLRDRVFRPICGERFVSSATPIVIASSSANNLVYDAESVRETKRVFHFNGGYDCDVTGWILDDITSTHEYCVEIKPKWGFQQHAECRFCAHQILKLRKGEVSTISEYCPLDFFSGKKESIRRSLTELWRTPNNNLKVFLKGQRVDCTRHIDLIPRLVQILMDSSDCLDGILQLQQLNGVGISSLYPRYLELSQTELDSLDRSCFAEDFLDHLPLRKMSPTVLDECREFLLSCTAKDVSIMIALDKNPNVPPRVEIVDVDFKSNAKMSYWFKLEKEIVLI